jgi:hypothetical protein
MPVETLTDPMRPNDSNALYRSLHTAKTLTGLTSSMGPKRTLYTLNGISFEYIVSVEMGIASQA